MDSRETRDFAREIKFVTTLAMRPRLLEWSRANLAPDGHGTGIHADEYSTCSLYFETPKFDVYSRKESYGKSKYRIRRYGQSDVVFLERKFRTDRLLAKRRTTVPVADMERLAQDTPDANWAGYWFHRRVKLRGLQPLIQLSYERVARIGASSTGPVRMTIDANLRVLPMPDRTFLAGVGMPILQDVCIIEVKYRVQLPVVFKDLAEKFGLEVQKISKFRAGLRSLDYPLPKEDDEQVPLPPGPESDHTGIGHWD
jgi:hypothetical protein